MNHCEAIYRHGVFEPLAPVNLPDDQRVRLTIEPAGEEIPQSWLKRVRLLQDRLIERRGVLPDSAAEIAADRMR